MASLQFQIHTDKENASSSGLKMPLSTTGKIFQTSLSQPLATPRRALGSVNVAHRVGGTAEIEKIVTQSGKTSKSSTKGGGISVASDQKPKKALHEKGAETKQRRSVDKENNVSQKIKLQEFEKSEAFSAQSLQTNQPLAQNKSKAFVGLGFDEFNLPDIEYMPPPSTVKDDDEDYLPLSERASTYVNMILSWRPHCLFGMVPESDEEEEKREHQQIMDELDKLPLPGDDFSSAAPEIFPEEIDLSSIDLPSGEYLDITDGCVSELKYSFENANTTTTSTISELDDSAGLLPHLGSLEILDDSYSKTT